MAQSIFITSAEGHSGKSTIALGVLDALSRATPRVGVFRPIARSTVDRDYVLEMLLDHDGVDLDYELCVGVSYDDVRHDPDAALATIIERYKAVEGQCDAVVIVGSDFTDVGSPAELGYNARIAANLGAPVVLVLSGRAGQGEQLGTSPARTPDELGQIASLALTELTNGRASLLAVVANRVAPDLLVDSVAAIQSVVDAANLPERTAPGSVAVWALPEDRFLVAPSVRGVMRALDAELVKGDPELLTREVLGVLVGGMSMVNVLPRLSEGSLVIIPADRTEVLLATLLAHRSGTFPSLSGIILNGPFPLPDDIDRLIDGLGATLPIIATDLDTYETALRVMSTRGRLAADSQRRVVAALAMFETHVDTEALVSSLGLAQATVVTPLMFEYGLMDRARANRKHIVLPEGDDDRILRAAAACRSTTSTSCSIDAAECSDSPASRTCATSRNGWSRGMPWPPSPSRSTCTDSGPMQAPTSPGSAASTSSHSPPGSARIPPSCGRPRSRPWASPASRSTPSAMRPGRAASV